MTREESIKKKLVRKLKDARNKYPTTYSDKVYDAVTIDEGIQEVENFGIRKGLEMAILIIEADETESEKSMTEEEAIEMLKKDKEQRGNCLISDAVDMGIDSLEKEPKMLAEIAHLRKYISKLETQIVGQEPVLDKIKGYINHIRNTGLGKKKSLEFIEKYIDGLKSESGIRNENRRL